jgi:CRAL/TRIO domain
MTSFTLSNMDYTPVKFMIKIFEANYPESLGAVLVHKSPWVFQGIWAIVKNWLDPVVAAKVHFTKSVDDLEEFVDRASIPRELGGKEEWSFRYVEPSEEEEVSEHARRRRGTGGDDDDDDDEPAMARKRQLEEERKAHVSAFQGKTFAWLLAAANRGGEGEDEAVADLAAERDRLATALSADYWALDPYIRARSLYDRLGVIGPAGVIDFYPEQRKAGEVSRVEQTQTQTQAQAQTQVNGVLPPSLGSKPVGVGGMADADPTADDVD